MTSSVVKPSEIYKQKKVVNMKKNLNHSDLFEYLVLNKINNSGRFAIHCAANETDCLFSRVFNY